MKPERNHDEELLRRIEDVFEQVTQQEPGARQELLRELGYDPDRVMKRGMQNIRGIRASQRLSLAADLWKQFNEIADKHTTTFEHLSGKQLRLTFEQVISAVGDKQQLATAHRDFQSVVDDDLKMILNDAGLLDQLDAFLNI